VTQSYAMNKVGSAQGTCEGVKETHE